MKIFIVRHCEPDYTVDSLTEKGYREAEILSNRLKNMNISDFYCSPLGRAKETARFTLEKCGKEAEILPWLKEFSGQAVLPEDGRRGIPWNLKPQFWTKERILFDKDNWLNHPIMAGGDVRAIYQDTITAFDNFLSRYGYQRDGYLYRCDKNNDRSIVLFCHFAIGMVLLSHLLGVAPTVLWQSFFMPTSSVTTLITEEREPGQVFFKCMQLGDTSHLYAANEPVSMSGLFPETYIY